MFIQVHACYMEYLATGKIFENILQLKRFTWEEGIATKPQVYLQ